MKLTDEQIDDLSYQILQVRDLISPMLEKEYVSSYDTHMKLSGGSTYLSRSQKVTLKLARLRIKKSVDILNKVANQMIP